MPHSLSRRTLVAAAPAALGTFLLDPTPLSALSSPTEESVDTTETRLHEHYPSQETEAVKQVVGASHFSLEKVRELVDRRPELSRAAWDWGFGDWETALGAASHTGNHEIAHYLIAQGARPDLFAAAMMGNLSVVRGLIEATPGLQALPGPHGISLRRHAELGGEVAAGVLAYLDELGGADAGTEEEPLLLEMGAYEGGYRLEMTPDDGFEVEIGSYDRLSIRRVESTARTLFHQGDHSFHPAGAPSARVHFLVSDGAVGALEIRNPDLVATARRV